MGRVIVVGSVNTDFILHCARLPSRGETVIGSSLSLLGGGKGANQAIAAARQGASVTFVGAVGDDPLGHQRKDDLAKEGIDVSFLMEQKGSSTGSALIFVDDAGHNMIGVASGANGELTPDDIAHALAGLSPDDILVTQGETPIDGVLHALAIAEKRGARAILNPAPMREEFATEIKSVRVDLLVLNEVELGQLVPSSDDQAERLAHLHQVLGLKQVVLTLGDKGCVLSRHGSDPLHVAAFPVEAIDTVAAGDTFVGALAERWLTNLDLRACVQWSSACAALACTRRGAQASIPRREEVEARWGFSPSP